MRSVVLSWHNAIYHEALKRDLMQLIFMFLSRKTVKQAKNSQIGRCIAQFGRCIVRILSFFYQKNRETAKTTEWRSKSNGRMHCERLSNFQRVDYSARW